MAIYPVPAGRTSDLLIHQRLNAQLQQTQLDLLRIQDQLGTGRRFRVPSEDAAAAVRAMTLQKLLEQKEQYKVNMATSQSYLGAADIAMTGVADVLIDVRGVAVAAADSTTGDVERGAYRQQVAHAVEQLLELGNRQFRGRYLFAGSQTTVKPFSAFQKYVVFHGNELELPSYSDTDFLFGTNVSANDVFGAISAGVQGRVDLNPIVTSRTRLVDLRGGAGITPGSIEIGDGTFSSTIDISSAETLGDVAHLIEGNPPAGRTLTARITTTGLRIEIDAAGGGNLTVREVGGGTTAAELGILQPTGVGISPIEGQDLDPVLRVTTPLRDVFGVRAAARIASAGPNNDVVLEALERGDAANGISVQFVDDSLLQAAPGLTAGNETVNFSQSSVPARAALPLSGTNNNLVLTANTAGAGWNQVQIELALAGPIGNSATASYDPGGQRLTLGIDSGGATQVQTLIAAINSSTPFTAAYDASDPADGGYVPTAVVQANDAGVVTGNTGNSGGEPGTIFVNIQAGRTKAKQIVAALESNGDVTSLFTVRLDEKDHSSPFAAGQGVVDAAAAAMTAGGSGLEFDQEAGIQIVNGGETHSISLHGAETVEDLLNLLNGSSASVLAVINPQGNGIDVHSRLSGADFSIGENGGATASQLGIRTFRRDTRLAELNHGRGVPVASGTDFVIRRTDGQLLEIDISAAQTVGDVLDLINNHPANADPLTAVTARLVAVGNGIELVDNNPTPANPLEIRNGVGSFATWGLGLVPRGEYSVSATRAIVGADVNPHETRGIFNSLTRLQQAIADNDLIEIERIVELIDEDLDRLGLTRVAVGAREQGLDAVRARIEDEEVQLRSTLSLDLDADVVETVSSLAAKQASLEASLRMVGRTLQLTLLDFL